MIVLQNAGIKAHILPYGATLCGLWHAGHASSLVLGSPDAAAYQDPLRYFGAVIGPVANRIANARIHINGIVWQMEANDGAASLHSGTQGLHAQDWQVSEQTESRVRLLCALAHGHGGLPGKRVFYADYQVLDTGCLRLSLSAISDRDTAINLAHHPYWTLDDQPTITAHRLQVMANTYLPVNADVLPTGEIAPVEGTAYDFRQATAMRTDIALDANLCLASGQRRYPQEAAVLSVPSGLSLRIKTTQAGLQIYNGHGMSAARVKMHDTQERGPCSGIALEPQAWPDAPHHSGFESIILPAQREYHQITEYHFST